MVDKAKLRQMVDDVIDGKPEQAQINFHDYMKEKMADMIEVPEIDLELGHKENKE